MCSLRRRRSARARTAVVALGISRAVGSSRMLAFVPPPPESSARGTSSRRGGMLAANGGGHPVKPYFADFSPVTADDGGGRPTLARDKHDDLVGSGKTAIVAGGTGYIGRACVRECVARGYDTVALVRDVVRASSDEALSGARLVECDVTDEAEVRNLFREIADGRHGPPVGGKNGGVSTPMPVDVVMSCLASASGLESEVDAIDYRATLNLLDAGRQDRVAARHFVLLSAFCCRNPALKLQQAKLRFEKELSEQGEMSYSIVRPTAFFKSVSGQYESILQGNSYVLFGDGAVTRCNPIAEEDLATYMCDSALEEYKETRWGKILNVGGPDGPLSNKMLGEMMFKAIDKPPKFVYVPTQIFDISISMIEFIAETWPSQKWEDALETAKIGKYYAVEDMLTTEEDEKFGSTTMMDHFEKLAREGQDPFTPVRATALIAKALEALPAVSISIPLGLGLLSRPGLVDNVITSSPLANVPMLLAGLNDGNIIS